LIFRRWPIEINFEFLRPWNCFCSRVANLMTPVTELAF